jgi:cell division initiation protein
MDLTPNEIRNHEFSRTFRGFSCSEVEAFKEAAASALEETRLEIEKLSEEIKVLREKYVGLRNLEDTIRNVVIDAQKNAEQVVADAHKEAEVLKNEARQKRDQIIEEKHRMMAELDTRIHEIEFTRRSFYSRLKAEIEAHLKLIEHVHIPDRKSNNPEPPAENHHQNPEPEPDRQPDSPDSGTDDNIDKIVDQFRQENRMTEE